MWIVEWRVCSLMREVWSVEWRVRSVKCEVWNLEGVDCEVWSVRRCIMCRERGVM